MKAIVHEKSPEDGFTAIGLPGLALRDVDSPTLPGPEWVRIKTTLGGIDPGWTMMLGAEQADGYLQATVPDSFVPGHQVVGVVESIGAKVKGIKVGDRVNVEIYPVLAAGETEETRAIGGGWGEVLVAHGSQVHRVPANVTDAEALIATEFAAALHAVLQYRPRSHDPLTVIGSGPAAIGIVSLLRGMGCQSEITVIADRPSGVDWIYDVGADAIVDVDAENMLKDYAREAGAKVARGVHGEEIILDGPAWVYDTVGTTESIRLAGAVCAKGGAVVLTRLSTTRNADLSAYLTKELRLLAVTGHGLEMIGKEKQHALRLVYSLLAQEKLDLDPFLTHRYKVSDAVEAFTNAVTAPKGDVVSAAFAF
jgi:threonine dehydrogenase-like Zn-dependent dehydrogenase